MGDLALGVRLSVGGGRTSWARLALSAVGIAVAVAVLLIAASAGTMSGNRDVRRNADLTVTKPIDGVHPTYANRKSTQFHDVTIRLNYVAPSAPDSPKPAELPALPKAGEMYVSPELAALLGSPESELLRPRLPEKIVGELADGLVPVPGDLIAWIGVDSQVLENGWNAEPIYRFGASPQPRHLDPAMLTLLLIGSTVLLLPVFIFITSATRIAGAERDRRLSALRLVGAGSRQVRRIAAGEALVSAFVGLLLGGAVFAVGRLFTADIDLFGERFYVADVVPDPVLTVLIVALIPALAVMTALFALRRTIIEPLGVVRQSKPVHRRLWWRAALIVLGVVLMTTQLGAKDNTEAWAWAVTGGAVLLLVGVPVLLPWLVERVAGWVAVGPSSWLLAIRRLQLDSGTSARVVGGVAVVLAGAIALQTLLLSVEGGLSLPSQDTRPPGTVQFSARPDLVDTVAREVGAADGVQSATTLRMTGGYLPGDRDTRYSVAILDCAGLRALAEVRQCADGDVFLGALDYQQPPARGTKFEWRQYPNIQNEHYDPSNFEVTGSWTVPQDARTITLPRGSAIYHTVLVTPGALAGTTLPTDDVSQVYALVNDNLTVDQLEGIRNAVADHQLDTYVYSFNTAPDLNVSQQTYLSIRTGLYAGSIFTLLLAGISLLVLALEHIRERRRQLAVLSATGVPRGVLGRSLLWQVALPIGLGTVVALVTGIGLAALVADLAEERLLIDWAGVTWLCAGAIGLSLLVSAMTMPFLRSATRLTALRTE